MDDVTRGTWISGWMRAKELAEDLNKPSERPAPRQNASIIESHSVLRLRRVSSCHICIPASANE